MTAEERFWVKVDKDGPGGCWLWTASQNGRGYGQIRVSGRLLYAHRVAYELEVGPIPEGLTIDHLCRNPSCVRPDHLEIVTMKVNALRGTSPPAQNAEKERCQRGHPLTESNLVRLTGKREGHRRCKQCHSERQRRYNRKQRAA